VSAARSGGLDLKDAGKARVLLDEVGHRHAIEGGEERLERAADGPDLPAIGRQRAGIGLAVEAFGERHASFEEEGLGKS